MIKFLFINRRFLLYSLYLAQPFSHRLMKWRLADRAVIFCFDSIFAFALSCICAGAFSTHIQHRRSIRKDARRKFSLAQALCPCSRRRSALLRSHKQVERFSERLYCSVMLDGERKFHRIQCAWSRENKTAPMNVKHKAFRLEWSDRFKYVSPYQSLHYRSVCFGRCFARKLSHLACTRLRIVYWCLKMSS